MSKEFSPAASRTEIAPVDRIIGFSETEQNKIAALYDELEGSYKKGAERLVDEVEKTERQIEIIHFVQKSLDEFMDSYGRPAHPDVPLDRIHIILKPKNYHGKGGSYNIYRQQITVVMTPEDAEDQFAMRLFHELFHSASYVAIQQPSIQKEDPKDMIDAYRIGLMTINRQATEAHFTELNEAVVQTATSVFFHSMMTKSPIFQTKDQQHEERVEPDQHMYADLRVAFDALVKDVFSKSQAKFEEQQQTEDDVRDIFIRASAAGKILKLARLIESTYGKGSFRKLGEHLIRFCYDREIFKSF